MDLLLNYLDKLGALYIITQVKELLSKKVDKVDGKGLSANDYDATEKDKVSTAHTHSQAAHAPSGAQANVIETVKLNGTALAPNNKAVDITLSKSSVGLDNVDNTSDVNKPISSATQAALNAKANLISPEFTGTPKVPTANAGTNNTQAASTEFVTKAITNAVSGITSFELSVVSSLPGTGVKGTIYFLPNGGPEKNVYDEYIWVNNKFEKVGTFEIDLSGYMLKTDMVPISNSEIDAMFAL